MLGDEDQEPHISGLAFSKDASHLFVGEGVQHPPYCRFDTGSVIDEPKAMARTACFRGRGDVM